MMYTLLALSLVSAVPDNSRSAPALNSGTPNTVASISEPRDSKATNSMPVNAAAMPNAAVPVVAGAARFNFFTGRQLYERCVDPSQINGSYCFAYVAGVHDLARSYETWLNVREFCLPSGTTQADLRDTFLNFARRRPADLDGQAASIVLAATKERFRCVVGR